MLPCRCAGVLIVAFGCVCGSVNNSTALGKTVLHSFLSACWLVIPFHCRSVCGCVCPSACVCVCLLVGNYVRGLLMVLLLSIVLDVNN